MARHKDHHWVLNESVDAQGIPPVQVQIALLMDIRDELKELNFRLNSSNATALVNNAQLGKGAEK